MSADGAPGPGPTAGADDATSKATALGAGSGPAAASASPGARWQGRPVTTLIAADVRAGLVALLATAAVLVAGFAPLREAAAGFRGVALEQAVGLALGYGLLVGVSVMLARAAGGRRLLVLATAFSNPITAACAVTGATGLVLPAVTGLLSVAAVASYWRQARRTRYEVAGRRVTIARPGYTVVFDMTSPPTAVPDPFGGTVGDIDFGPVDAKLITRTGVAFKVVGRRAPLERVADASRTAEALGAALRSA